MTNKSDRKYDWDEFCEKLVRRSVRESLFNSGRTIKDIAYWCSEDIGLKVGPLAAYISKLKKYPSLVLADPQRNNSWGGGGRSINETPGRLATIFYELDIKEDAEVILAARQIYGEKFKYPPEEAKLRETRK